MDFDRLIPIIRRLALEAGDRIMEVYNGPEFEVKSKSDASPVTEADEAADAIISAGLRAAFPDVVLITEEQAASHALTAQTFLIVDPLDGTKEFVQRRGDFTVNIAYVENGVPLRGVVYAPAQGRLFYTRADGQAVEETGALDKVTPGATRAISVSKPDNTALMVVASKSHRDAATDDYRFQPEVLSGGHGRGRSLPPPWPDHGMGHRRRRCRLALRGRPGGAL
jgi:3'(2'), 5'-bisphosphate nucleotidase